MTNKVSVGYTSVIGWLGALAALMPTVVRSAESGQADLAGPEKYLAITGLVLGTVTQIGRYLQAHKLIGLNVGKIVEDVDSVIPKPESAVTPDAPNPAA